MRRSILIVLLSFPASLLAQTGDGVPPANEGICDELIGATPGLYGLCVAFCESQDFASLSNPITSEELATLEAGIPSGRILANYNKLKTPSDPPMPCILVEEPCPCWSAEEIASIDGVIPTEGGGVVNGICDVLGVAFIPWPFGDDPFLGGGFLLSERLTSGTTDGLQFANLFHTYPGIYYYAPDWPDPGEWRCADPDGICEIVASCVYQNRQPLLYGQPPISRSLQMQADQPNGDSSQYDACWDLIIAQAFELNWCE